MLLVLAGHNGWVVHHMDVNSVLLNGVPGFAVVEKENKVLRLRKVLYCLKSLLLAKPARGQNLWSHATLQSWDKSSI
jgi:hypothetical protein